MMFTKSLRPMLCGAALICLTAFPKMASAQAIQQSEWSTNYGSYNGNVVNTFADLRFNYSGGSYRINGGCGYLTNVVYDSFNHTISGRWNFANETGWFRFNVQQNGTQFNGIWGYGFGGPAVGYWNGTYAGNPGGPLGASSCPTWGGPQQGSFPQQGGFPQPGGPYPQPGNAGPQWGGPVNGNFGRPGGPLPNHHYPQHRYGSGPHW